MRLRPVKASRSAMMANITRTEPLDCFFLLVGIFFSWDGTSRDRPGLHFCIFFFTAYLRFSYPHISMEGKGRVV